MGKKSPIFLFLWEKDDIFVRKRNEQKYGIL